MSNFVVPVSGSTYMIQNGGLANIVPHVLDNSERVTTDGNPTLSWSVDVPKQNNQIVGRIQSSPLYDINSRFLQWTYLTYPSSTNATVFTLQSVETVSSVPSFGGRGGYVRVDPTVGYLRSSFSLLLSPHEHVHRLVDWFKEEHPSLGSSYLCLVHRLHSSE